jgi:hypothetical protein
MSFNMEPTTLDQHASLTQSPITRQPEANTMPKQRQIRYFHKRQTANGSSAYYWLPSAALKKLGWTATALGTNAAQAAAQAITINEQVDAWRKGSTPATGQVKQAPRIFRMAELIQLYERSSEFVDLRAATKREYRSRLRQISRWADDGRLPIDQVDTQMVMDLRSGLMSGSRWKAAGILRVLRLLFNWAKPRYVSTNPVDDVRVPEPKSRITQMPTDARAAITRAAMALGMDDVALAIELAFWTIQREGDLLAFNKMKWRVMEGLDDPRHIAPLADPRGRVMCFRFQQFKTGVWADTPIPPALHRHLLERMNANPAGWLFANPLDPQKPMPDWRFQRRFRAARDEAADQIEREGRADAASALRLVQFRDLRRTGMVFYGNVGCEIQWITALSRHSVMGRKSILDTYMPGDPRGAAACVATGLLALARRTQIEAG